MQKKIFSNPDFVISIIENSYDGIYITSKDGLTLYVNSAYEKLSGQDRSNYVGKYMSELMESGIMNAHITKDVVQRKETVTISETLVSGKDVLITGSPILDDNNEVIGVVTNVRDMSEILTLKKNERISEEIISLYKKQYFKGVEMDNIICESPNSIAVFNMAQKVSSKDSTVLLTGETGTGKEVVAKYIHHNSSRKNENYVKINCGAIPANLLESELFGYVGGAFTGANPKGKPGLFELANNGTLFLDEIGELPLELQASMLRVLQESEITRVGDTKSRKINVRIITATNRDLKKMIAEGTFREDLYYRLNVISINIPPLRERQEDIPALAEFFIRNLNEKYGDNKTVSDTFLYELMNKSWPGNIRELSNFIERQFIMSDFDVLEDIVDVNLHHTIQDHSSMVSGDTSEDSESLNMEQAVAKTEAKLMKAALERSKNTKEAAELLGISQPTFSRKYNRYKNMCLL